MKYAIALVFLMGACTVPQSRVDKVDILLRNTTSHPIEVRARAGFFSKTIRLQPGEAWKGWIPPQVPVSEIVIDVKEGKVKTIARP
jgi:hypothetical protein